MKNKDKSTYSVQPVSEIETRLLQQIKPRLKQTFSKKHEVYLASKLCTIVHLFAPGFTDIDQLNFAILELLSKQDGGYCWPKASERIETEVGSWSKLCERNKNVSRFLHYHFPNFILSGNEGRILRWLTSNLTEADCADLKKQSNVAEIHAFMEAALHRAAERESQRRAQQEPPVAIEEEIMEIEAVAIPETATHATPTISFLLPEAFQQNPIPPQPTPSQIYYAYRPAEYYPFGGESYLGAILPLSAVSERRAYGSDYPTSEPQEAHCMQNQSLLLAHYR